MLFNSLSFIAGFLPVVLIAYWTARRHSVVLAIFVLTAASYFFYGWWDIRNVPILVGSVAFNFLVGLGIDRLTAFRKPLVVFGITANLLLLGYYKYAGFLVENIPVLGFWHAPAIADLPIGISFFTFTQIAYLVDVYQRKASDQRPLSYALFVSYFPHLIAGPILHHKEMMPQFADTARRHIPSLLSLGLAIFVVGLLKKVLLADPVAVYAGPVFTAFDGGQALSMADAWTGALAYSLQLYFDFSGYSDMAVGLSLMFGIRLPINFFSPYQATSIIEFWRRWHMTLSRFLRDYLYVPLGGNRRGEVIRYRNLAITMVLGGLWHGAAWTFVLWGALHGAYLIVNHLFRQAGGRLPFPVGWALTMVLVVVAWVFFRSQTVDGAISMVTAMFTPGTGLPRVVASKYAIMHVAALSLLVVIAPNIYQVTASYHPALLPKGFEDLPLHPLATPLRWEPTVEMGVAFGIGFCAALFLITREFVPSEFLYFQF